MKSFLICVALSLDIYATALHQAVIDINEAKVHRLIEAGADVNAVNEEGKTALHLASPIGRYSLVEYLVEHGAQVHIKDKSHKTALVYAIEKNRIKVIIYLSKIANEQEEQNEEDPLFEAARKGDMDYVAYALSRSDINRVNKDGKTALHVSSEAGQYEIVAFLLNLGANRKLLDDDGRTALNYAKLSGNKELSELLLRYNNETK